MKKILSVIISLATLISLTACESTEQSASTQKSISEISATQLSSTTISGTVTAVDEETVTIKTDDGEEISFTLSDQTQYSVEMMSGDGQQNGQAVGDESTPPEMPDGNGQQGEQNMGDGSTPPEMPDGDGQQGGMPPEMQQNGQGMGDGSTPPEMPDGNGQQGGQNMGDGSTPPDKPDGDGQQGGQNTEDGSTPPEKPDGDGQQGEMPPEMQQGGQNTGDESTPPEMPSGNMQQGASENGENQNASNMLKVGSVITVTLADDGTAASIEIQMDGNPMGNPGGEAGGFGGGDSININYTAANNYAEDTTISGQNLSSSEKDENAILVTGGEVSVNGSVIDRVSEDSTGGDNASFYGVGAAVLTTGGTVNISDSTITTDASGGAGVFAYGDGVAYVSDCTIETQKDTSGGVHVAGGGTLYAWDLNVETNGQSSAAIRSDRGSGTMVIDGGEYVSNGTGSPAIYSTADISVNDADLTANGSEAICIEGKNSIHLYDCNLSGNMKDDSQNDCTWNVILYQSMSGDSAEGNSIFEMIGGTLTANNGGMFYTTNTESTFVLSDVEIEASEDSEFFLKCTGNNNQRGWGSTGKNGAQCKFTAIDQDMSGDVIWDSISTLDFYMTEESSLEGAFIKDETCAGNGDSGYVSLTIDKGSTWVVTKNSTLTSLYLEGSIVDANGKTVSVVGTDGTVYVSGDSELTVTVDNFKDAVDLTLCSTLTSFSDCQVEKK